MQESLAALSRLITVSESAFLYCILLIRPFPIRMRATVRTGMTFAFNWLTVKTIII